MKRIFGNTGGLKASQVRRLENLYRRRIPTEYIVTAELARDISVLSHEIQRQIGLLINRGGRIEYVVVGDHQKIIIPDTSEYRTAPGRLRGLRCVHTHLKNEPLTRDDLTDLALLRLDLMAAITAISDGLPSRIHMGHILPENTEEAPYKIFDPIYPNTLDIGCLELIQALEDELSQKKSIYKADSGKERAILVGVMSGLGRKEKDQIDELKELVMSCGMEVVGSFLQLRKSIDARFLLGLGKLQELSIFALQKGATLIIFDQELNPSQIRSITDTIDLKVIDRTQLILDIFAQRAQSREGKLQVELAQLKYLLPRLIVKNTAMSRLTGGIGGRGPGETKLEINRRRVRDRIKHLEKNVSEVRKQRKQQKAKREKKKLPIISIVGYTNAGKSTLLNTLTKSNVRAENRLFATLDPSSRRLKFPEDIEVIVTDTVGFIENIPKDLLVAFRATLEELESANLLLHVIDIHNPRVKEQIESVEKLLADLDLDKIPLLRVLNKQDLVEKEMVQIFVKSLQGVPISAKSEDTLGPLIKKMRGMVSTTA
ncbi:MAG: GTPase HflX [Desulfobacterales bacterium]|nr:GTPase HflX [Desulfobacterales bacterium]